jgi:hypothetical protein
VRQVRWLAVVEGVHAESRSPLGRFEGITEWIDAGVKSGAHSERRVLLRLHLQQIAVCMIQISNEQVKCRVRREALIHASRRPRPSFPVIIFTTNTYQMNGTKRYLTLLRSSE